MYLQHTPTDCRADLTSYLFTLVVRLKVLLITQALQDLTTDGRNLPLSKTCFSLAIMLIISDPKCRFITMHAFFVLYLKIVSF
jgi:hypothetical protein